MYLTVKSTTDANILQNDLHALEQWEQDWSMEFNSDKCEVLRITKKLKKWLIILMSALSSNTAPPSGVPGKKLYRKKLKVFNGQQHVMYATTTTTQAV